MPDNIKMVIIFFSTGLINISSGYCDNAPRDYLPAPPGTQLLFSSIESRSGSDLYSKGVKLANNSDYQANYWITKYGYYSKIGKWNSAIVTVLGYAKAS
jgi:hypothetical protein